MTASRERYLDDRRHEYGTRQCYEHRFANSESLDGDVTHYASQKVLCRRRRGTFFLVAAARQVDELNGVEIIRRLTKRKQREKIRGTSVSVSVVNAYGTLNQLRYLPDRRDLNRPFPTVPWVDRQANATRTG